MANGRHPDMNLTAYDKTRKVWKQVGVAWTNEDGTIAIALDPGTALIYDQNIMIKLWPRDRDTGAEYKPAYEHNGDSRGRAWGDTRSTPRRSPAAEPSKPTSGFDDMDDIPF